jgi:hypothetical protein
MWNITAMIRQIIDSNSTESVCEIFKVPSVSGLYDSKAVDWDTPPYVRIGNLFVSLMISGPDSWNYLATKVCVNEKLTVLAGRHGNVINPIDSSGWLRRKEESLGGGDMTDPMADQKIAAVLNRQRQRITVVDVRDDAHRTTDKNPDLPQLRWGNPVLVLRSIQHAGEPQCEAR